MGVCLSDGPVPDGRGGGGGVCTGPLELVEGASIYVCRRPRHAAGGKRGGDATGGGSGGGYFERAVAAAAAVSQSGGVSGMGGGGVLRRRPYTAPDGDVDPR